VKILGDLVETANIWDNVSRSVDSGRNTGDIEREII
jgi:hypothetical protein